MTPGMADVQLAMVNWHLVSFGRFAAAYHLAAHGYYFDAIALARDLWEVGLSLAALQKNVVTVDELMASAATTMQDAERMSRETDGRIRRALIRENTALSSESRQAIDTFLHIANAATHKSKLPLRRNLLAWGRGGLTPYFSRVRFEARGSGLSRALPCLVGLDFDAALPRFCHGWKQSSLDDEVRQRTTRLSGRDRARSYENRPGLAWCHSRDLLLRPSASGASLRPRHERKSSHHVCPAGRCRRRVSAMLSPPGAPRSHPTRITSAGPRALPRYRMSASNSARGTSRPAATGDAG